MRPVLATQATDFANHPLGADNALWREAMESQTRVIAETARALDVALIDLRPELSDRAAYFADVLHMTAEGNRRRAELIRRKQIFYCVRAILAGRPFDME